jgi:hypothetical protein
MRPPSLPGLRQVCSMGLPRAALQPAEFRGASFREKFPDRILLSLSISLLTISLFAAGRASALDLRHLAGTTTDYEWLWIEPGGRGNWVGLDYCSVLSFTPTSRAYIPTPSQSDRTPDTEIISRPICEWRDNFAGPYGILLRKIRSTSIRDLGTYVIRCTNAQISLVNCVSWSSIGLEPPCPQYYSCAPRARNRVPR